ncbi:MAG: hypothetical protein AAGB05_17815 [Pseudomonadota bacterium]
MRGALLAGLIALAVAPFPSAAERALARNGLAVQGDRDGFEVFSRAGLGGVDYFCAAGDFARKHLNAAATERVEIAAPLGPSRSRPGQRSVVFEVRPPGRQANRGLDLVLLRPGVAGVSRTVAQSANFCTRPDIGEQD